MCCQWPLCLPPPAAAAPCRPRQATSSSEMSHTWAAMRARLAPHTPRCTRQPRNSRQYAHSSQWAMPAPHADVPASRRRCRQAGVEQAQGQPKVSSV